MLRHRFAPALAVFIAAAGVLAPSVHAQQLHPIDPGKLMLPTPTPTVEVQLPPPSKLKITPPTPTPPALQLPPPSKLDPTPPTPTPVVAPQTEHGAGAFQQQYIAPPMQLQSTADPNTCSDHSDVGGGIFCGAALEANQLVLIWNWQSPETYHDPANPNVQYTVVKDIDGFHLYDLVPSLDHKSVQRHLASWATGGPRLTWTALDPPQTPFAVPCYVVRAFKGQLESMDSQPFCPGAAPSPATATISLSPSLIRTIQHTHTRPFALVDCGATAGLVVGYEHCSDFQGVRRVLFYFNTAALGPIVKATLRFHRDSTWLMGTDPEDNDQPSDAPQDEPQHGRTDANCARELLLPTYDWISNGWNDGDPEAAPPVTDLPTDDFASVALFDSDPSFDVTDLVTRWREFPTSNNGFALRGGDEYTAEEDWNRCESVYSNFVLEVTHLQYAAGNPGRIDPGTVGVPGNP